MWNNIGHRLQSLAKIVCWLGLAGSLIWAVAIWNRNSETNPTVLAGILHLVIGGLASWIGSWAMYGLGLVVEHVENGGTVSAPQKPVRGIRTEDGGVRTTAGNTWLCPKCGNSNPFSRITCKHCGSLRV